MTRDTVLHAFASWDSSETRIPTSANVWTVAGRASSRAGGDSGRDDTQGTMKVCVTDAMALVGTKVTPAIAAVVVVTGTSIMGVETTGEACIKEDFRRERRLARSRHGTVYEDRLHTACGYYFISKKTVMRWPGRGMKSFGI